MIVIVHCVFFVALEVKVKVRAYQFANKLNFPLLLKRSRPAVAVKWKPNSVDNTEWSFSFYLLFYVAKQQNNTNENIKSLITIQFSANQQI